MIELVELGKCCEIVNGSTPSRIKPEFWNGDIDWFTPKDLSKIVGKYVDEAPEKITEAGFKSCSTQMIPAFSLLFTSRAPIGHLAINKRAVCTNQGFKSLIPSSKVDVNYLYYVIKNLTPDLEFLGNGATFKELSKATMSSFRIPLPPLPIQQKIAAILDAADELRQKDKALLKKYDEFTQALFLDMFGDPVSNKRGFVKSSIGNECTVKGGKRIPKEDNLVLENTSFPYIKAGNIKGGKITTKNIEYLKPETREKLKRYIVNEGDVCITVVGANIGDIGVVPKELHLANLTENANKLLINDAKKLNNIYLSNYLQMDFSQKHIGQRTMAVGVPKLALFRIQQLELLLPPILLQNKFAESVKIIEKQKTMAQQGAQKSEELFNSLLQKAFNGELIKETKKAEKSLAY